MKTIETIQCVFKLKGYKAEPPVIYLGASLEKVKTKGKNKYLSMSAEKDVKANIVNIQETLAKRDMRLPTSHYPITTTYHPSTYVSNELNTIGVQAYQEKIFLSSYGKSI